MTTTDERPQSSGTGQRIAKAGVKHLARKIGWIAVAKIGFWVAVGLVLLLAVMAAGAVVAGKKQADVAAGSGATTDGGGCATPAACTEWDAGNIISDAVFYNSQALPDEAAVQAALDKVGGSCTASTCLRLDTYATTPATSAWCRPYPVPQNGNPERYAVILLKLAQVCGVNPQVAIVMVMKESQGLTRAVPPAALTGFGCPDTGPGGSANCQGSAGVWAQTLGMFTSFAKLHQDAKYVNYPEGKTSQILWNVKETGCGAAPVLVANRATATLYTYTPYQPNAAALAAYPGVGDACSAYGNRNFFRMFQNTFGPTGGGKDPTGASGAAQPVLANGVQVTIPSNAFVAQAARGQVITAPTAKMAAGIAAGFSKLGGLYVWGGGFGPGGEATNGCARGGTANNACQGFIGFDCSGLTNYVYVQGGYPSPGGNSGAQRSGPSVPYSAGVPGDLVGFPGHIAVYLGLIGGTPYILEASWVGTPIHVVPLARTDRDANLWRHWT
jgi:cell wall-associated NlpC family hydrolase